ncbi:MAG: GAF domain-containing protein [Crinalium sp.]
MKSQTNKKPKILVVDDEPDNLDLLYRTFYRDYRVLRADSGPAALEMLDQEGDVAVIISDQRMPMMSGTEFLSRTAVKYPDIIRIILTGYTDVEDLVEAINAGKVFKYVTKPWDAQELKEVVRQALDTYNVVKLRTQELYRTLRRESLLNTVINTIRNAQYTRQGESPLRQILQTIVESVGQMLEADICILRPIVDEQMAEEWFVYEKPKVITQQEDSQATAEKGDAHSYAVLGQTVWETREVEVVNDIATTEYFEASNTENTERIIAYQKADIRSSLVVPLITQNELMAVLALHQCGQPRNWQDDEIQLAVMVADQAVLALSQVRAYEQVHALAQRATLVNTITTAIRSSLDPQDIFAAITQQLGQALKVDGCALSLWTEEDEFVQCVGLYDSTQASALSGKQLEEELKTNNGSLKHALPQSLVPIAENPVLQQLLQTQKPVVSSDLVGNSQLGGADLPLREPSKALLVVPLIVDGKIIGSISLRQTERLRRWQQTEIALAEAVASQAAIAVQQAKLYQKTQENERRVQQLNTYLTESVLKRFLPPGMVKQCATGTMSLDLRPEPRLITILFSDIVGFTQLSNTLRSRRVAQLLNEYLEAMTKAVFDNGGAVDKFMGDAILALFGAPEELTPNEQVRRSIAAARQMHKSLGELNQRWQEQGIVGTEGRPPVQFRCGIHQGTAVVGMFGSAERSDYTAIGPSVNIAARLQVAAEPNSILVSAVVADYLEDEEITKGSSLNLKGIDETVLTFSVDVNPVVKKTTNSPSTAFGLNFGF